MPNAPHAVHARPRPRTGWRRWLRRPVLLLILVVSILVGHALNGEQGFSSPLTTWRTYHRLTAQVSALRTENVRLRLVTHRLRGDLATIEAVARQELGLIQPGETVFLIRDVSGEAGLPRR